MRNWSDKLALVVVTFWVGALWAIGYLAAPALFSTLPNKQLAGMLAGKMFTLVAYVGMASALYLLIHRFSRFGAAAMRQSFFWATLAMLALTMIGHFGIQPIVTGLRAEAMPADVMHSVFADRFRTWHGVASIAYLLQSLLGLVLVLKSER